MPTLRRQLLMLGIPCLVLLLLIGGILWTRSTFEHKYSHLVTEGQRLVKLAQEPATATLVFDPKHVSIQVLGSQLVTASFNSAHDVANVYCTEKQHITCTRLDRAVTTTDDYSAINQALDWCQIHLEGFDNPERGNDVYSVTCE